MADYNLGTARGKIQVDYDGRGIAAAKKDVGTLGTATDRSNESMRRTGIAVGAASAVIGAGLIFAAKTAIDFEKQISAVAAVSGATAEELDLVRKKALQLGRDTAFSASESANAMEELAKAGIKLPDILNGAADATVALAAAGGVELPIAAELAANAMNAFGLSAREMPKIADLIAGAANASAIDVGDFGQSLKQVGAVANLVGLDFRDTAVAIALMGQAGIKGSDAGTSLKTMLSNLQPVTTRQIRLFKDLGLVTKDGSNAFFDAQGNVKGLGDIAGILQDKLKNMTSAQKSATLELIFGSDAIRAAAVLTQAGAKGFEDMATAMGKVTAADVAKKRLDNVAGALDQLKGSAETLAIAIGTALLPTIRKIAETMTIFANALSGLDPKIQKTVVTVLAITAAVGGLVAAIAILRAGVIALDIAALFNPVTLAILAAVVAVGLIAFAIKKAWDNSKAFRDTILTIRDAIQNNVLPPIREFARIVAAELKPRFEEFVQFVRTNAVPLFAKIQEIVSNQIVPALRELNAWWNQNKASIQPVLSLLAGLALTAAKITAVLVGLGALSVFGALAGGIRLFVIQMQLLSAVATAVKIGVVAAFNFISNAIGSVIGFVVRIVEAIRSFGSASTTATSGAAGAFGSLLNVIRTIINTIISVIRTFAAISGAIFATGFAVWRAITTGTMTAILGTIRAVWSAIGGTVMGAINFIRAGISNGFNFIKGLISGAMVFVAGRISSTFNTIRSIVSAIMGAISSRIQAGMSAISSAFNQFSAILGKIRAFFNGMRTAAEGGTGSLVAFVRGIPGKILAALGNLGSLLMGAGRSVIDGFVNGIRGAVGRVADAARSIANAIPGPIKKILGIGSPSKVAINLGQDVTRGLAIGVLDKVDLVRRASEEAAEAVRIALSSMPLDSSIAVSTAMTGAMRGGGGSSGSTSGSAAPAQAPGSLVNQTFNVPAAMNEKELAAYAARRIGLVLDGATNTGGAA